MSFMTWLRGDTVDLVTAPPSRVELFHDTLNSLRLASALSDYNYRSGKALSVAAIYRARQMNADTLASLPVKANGVKVPPPNQRQNWQQFVAEIVLAMQDHGEAYLRVDRSRGEAEVLHNGHMSVTWNPSETKRIYAYNQVEMRTEGLARNLYVISMNRGDHALTGTGPMESQRINGLIAEQEFVSEFFENNAQPTGTLTHPGVLTPDESQALYEAWEAGQDNGRSTGILSGGIEYRPTSFNMVDSAWTEAHMIGIGDVASLFGVPSTLLNYNQPGSSLTYESIGDVYEGYWRQTLAPTYARRIEAAWLDIAGLVIRFDPEELFLASLAERSNATAVLINSGFEPAAAADVAGLPPMAHTGEIPNHLDTGGQE